MTASPTQTTDVGRAAAREEAYLCEYQHAGETWAVHIIACSSEDAAARLRAIGRTGQVLGHNVIRIPVPGGSLILRFLNWIRT